MTHGLSTVSVEYKTLKCHQVVTVLYYTVICLSTNSSKYCVRRVLDIWWAIKKIPGWWHLTLVALYKVNGYLITFQFRPQLTHARECASSTYPAMLEVPAEGFVWNLPQFGLRIRFDVSHGSETWPIWRPIIRVRKSQATRGEIQRLRRLGDERNIFFLTRHYYTSRDVWLCALLWCRNHTGPAPSELHGTTSEIPAHTDGPQHSAQAVGWTTNG
jgi:hypothetical protein